MPLSTYNRGFFSEYLAVAMLMLKGYRILNLRYRNRMGEIDIIALRARTIAFVEVKTLKQPNLGFPAVGAMQIERIRRAASLYLSQRDWYSLYEPRFDLITVSRFASMTHHENVF